MRTRVLKCGMARIQATLQESYPDACLEKYPQRLQTFFPYSMDARHSPLHAYRTVVSNGKILHLAPPTQWSVVHSGRYYGGGILKKGISREHWKQALAARAPAGGSSDPALRARRLS